MSNDIMRNLQQPSIWRRGLYMLLYAVFYNIAEFVLTAVVLFQFLLKLFTDEINQNLQQLGQNLSTYVYQILQYLTFNSDYRPYPFGEWPCGEPATGEDRKVLQQNRQEPDTTDT